MIATILSTACRASLEVFIKEKLFSDILAMRLPKSWPMHILDVQQMSNKLEGTSKWDIAIQSEGLVQ